MTAIPRERFAPADGTSFTTELSIDAFRLLTAPAGPLVVPDPLQAGPLPPERSAAARRELLDERLLTAGGVPHPLLSIALLLFRASRRLVTITSWTPASTSTTLGVIAGTLTSTVTVTVARDRTAAATDVARSADGIVRVSLGRFPLAVAHLARLVDTTDAATAPVGRHRIPVVAARAVVEAVRRGDDALVAEVARQVEAVPHVDLLRGLAETLESGVRGVAIDAGRPRWISEWFQTADGRWFTARLTAPTDDGAPTAELLAEEGELVIDVRPPSGVVDDVLALYAAWSAEPRERPDDAPGSRTAPAFPEGTP